MAFQENFGFVNTQIRLKNRKNLNMSSNAQASG